MFAYNRIGFVVLVALWTLAFSPIAQALPPTANAGPAQSVVELSTVTLDGSASSDSDGTISTYTWSETTSTGVTLTGNGTANPTFTAPAFPATVSFSLVVTDNDGDVSTNTSTVTISITETPNVAPTANAGPAQSAVELSTVTLDGSASSDSDGTISTYTWTETTSTGVTLSGNGTANPSFTAPAFPATVSFSLLVTDNDGDVSTNTSTVTISITETPNVAPTASAGTAQSVVELSTVTLDGSASSDSDGTISTYTWSETTSTGVTLSGNGTVNPSFTAPAFAAATTVSFNLVVTDNDGDVSTNTSTVTISITETPNVAPTADAGPDQNVNEFTSVALTGAASGDSDGSISSYVWTQTAGPVVSLSGATTVSPTFSAPAGAVVLSFNLVVTDNDGDASIADAVNISVNDINNLPTGTVSISGTPTQGQSLTASNDLADLDGMGGINYQWSRNGSVISGATGTGYILVQADVGNSITLTASYIDGGGANESVDSGSVGPIVNVNDPPVITNTPNTNALINTLYSFIPIVEDPDSGDTKSFTHNAMLPAWLSFNSETGELTGIPTLSDVGTNVSGVMTVADTAAATGTVSFNISVTGENSSPVISGTPLTSIAEDAVYSFMVSSTDPDIGDTASYFLQNNPAWMSINEATGMVNGLPLNSDVGTMDNIIVGVRDSVGVEDSLIFSLLVTNTNDAPIITSTAGSAATEDVLFSYTLIASDIDVGDTLTYSAPTLPDWLSFDISSQLLSGTPGDDEQGAYSVTLRVNDGTIDVDQSFTVLVTGTNDSPTISGTPDTIISEGSFYTFTPTASDPDMGSTLSFSIINQPAWASFDFSTGTLSGTPSAADFGRTSGIIIGVGDGIVAVHLPAFDLSVVDNNPPVVTAPADVTVNASGLFTRADFGVASAVDTLDGNLLASPNLDIYLSPGRHVVTWSATDLSGNTGTATQVVSVIPLVELAARQVSAEGSSGTVRLVLNGPAVNYPVSVPFTVSGTATPGIDHNFTDGIFIISEGTEASVSFNVLADSLVEGNETIIITLGEEVSNAVVGVQVTHTIELAEGNVAPQVSLGADQGDGWTHIVSQTDGFVEVVAMISDPNSGDTHIYDWSATDNSLVDNDGVTNNATFSFDPAAVIRGVYLLRVVVNDGTASGVAELMLNVVAKAPVLSLTSDSDNDGVADAVEGFGDIDNDGIADYLDAIEALNVLQGQAADQYLMEAETGLSLSLGSVAFQVSANQAGVSVADVVNYGNAGNAPVDEMSNLGGLFDFMISDLPVAGDSVRVVLPQLIEIPDNAVYRKLLPTGWDDFKEDSKNSLSSAPGLQGYCPPPGDIAYTPDLTAGHWCVQLFIEDGGVNDADGLANQHIADPGGVAQFVKAETVEVRSSGGTWHPMMFMLVIFLGFYRLRDKDIKK